MRVLTCLVGQHDLLLVALAVFICLAGCWTTVRLTARAAAAEGTARLAWAFIDAVAAGSAIWSTHFVSMLAYESVVAAGYEPMLTITSLMIAIVGCFGAVTILLEERMAGRRLIAGALFGATVSVMHFTGMWAYQVDGLILWDYRYLAASIVLALGIGMLAFQRMGTQAGRRDQYAAAGLLALAIVSLHFTAMAAISVVPWEPLLPRSQIASQVPLALTIALVSFLVVGTGFASYLVDDRGKLQIESRLRQLSRLDTLTGLPNRTAFADRLNQAIREMPAGATVALLSVDLDHFADINDDFGQEAGDKVLAILGKRAALCLRENEFVARLAGDEFAMLATVSRRDEGMELAERLERALCRPVWLGERTVALRASIGVAFYPDDSRDPATLMNNADLALQRAKATPGQVACFYREEMEASVRRRRRMVEELKAALAGEQFVVHYQVQQSVASRTVIGYEALIRWIHPDRGMISPADFIPLAEASGLINPIGEWVLRVACRNAAAWPSPVRVAVNISPLQFADDGLPVLIEQILAETGLPPSRLELELTESAILVDLERTKLVLPRLKAQGISLALDDFGSGYSSLGILRSLPFDKIKLDKTFMDEIEHSREARAVARAVIALGQALDIAVLAEGIETRAQLDFLIEEGCTYAQGYLLGRPAPLSDLPWAATA